MNVMNYLPIESTSHKHDNYSSLSNFARPQAPPNGVLEVVADLENAEYSENG
jgi:hypothetical protein